MMRASTRRRLGWLVRIAVVLLAYLALRTYADHARSMEAVLGLFHGNAAWHGLVAASVVLLRLAAYGVVGGALLAWPAEEVLLWRAARRAPTAGGGEQ